MLGKLSIIPAISDPREPFMAHFPHAAFTAGLLQTADHEHLRTGSHTNHPVKRACNSDWDNPYNRWKCGILIGPAEIGPSPMETMVSAELEARMGLYEEGTVYQIPLPLHCAKQVATSGILGPPDRIIFPGQHRWSAEYGRNRDE